MKRKLLVFTAGFTAAAVYTLALGLKGGVAIGIISAVLCVLFFLASVRYRPVAVIFLGLSLGMFWCAGFSADMDRRLAPQYLGTQTITAQILQEPEATQFGQRVSADITIESGTFEGTLFYKDAPKELHIGDVIGCTATLRRSTGNEDYVNLNLSKGVWLTANAQSEMTILPQTGVSLKILTAKLFLQVQKKCRELFSSDTYALMTAMITGNRQYLSEQTQRIMQETGIYHIIAVSGMHVSTLVGALYILFRKRRKLTALFGIPVVILFVLMSGAGPSAMRAGVMQILFLSSMLVRRENDPPTSLAAAMLVLLVINPWAICGASLQLSFAAVCGILLFGERMLKPVLESERYRKYTAFAPVRWLCTTAISSFALCISASAFTLPLLFYYFGYYSLLSPLSNLLVLWATTLAFSLGLLAVLFGFLVPPLGILLAKPVILLVRCVLFVTNLLSKIPFAVERMNTVYYAAWMVFAYLMLLLLLLYRKMPKVFSVCGLVVSYGLCVLFSALDMPTTGFTFSALDVGQGQCLVMLSGEAAVVVDCGGTNDIAAGGLAADYLIQNGAKNVDAMVLTHFDRDHIGGAETLMNKVQVETLYIPTAENAEDNALLDSLLKTARSRNVTVQPVPQTETVTLGSIELRIFDANENDSRANSGICVLASYGEYDILVTGDLSVKEENDMLFRYQLPQTELLVAGHHGSETSTGYGILQTTKPDTVLISVGKNSYGHPSAKTIDRIESYGAEIYRTDECGTITIRR